MGPHRPILGAVIVIALSFAIIALSFAITGQARADIAIAEGRDGYGATWWGFGHASSRQEAEALALRECERRGPNCEVRDSGPWGCYAIACAAPSSGTNGCSTARRETLEDARRTVMSACTSRAGLCEMNSEFCSPQQSRSVRTVVEPPATVPSAPPPSNNAVVENSHDTSNAAAQPFDQATVSVNFALTLIALALAALVAVIAKRSLPTWAKIALAIGAPTVAGIIHYFMGIDDELTVAQLTILSLPFFGSIALALILAPQE